MKFLVSSFFQVYEEIKQFLGVSSGWSSVSLPAQQEPLSDDEQLSEKEILAEIDELNRLKLRLSPHDAYFKSVSTRLQQLRSLLF